MVDQTVYVSQGEFKTSSDSDVVLSTVLGSCIAACLWDPEIGIGGMNHFLLANTTDTDQSKSLRYGVHAMEMLINDLLKKGARRASLRAKLFGGATMAANLGDIGTKNGTFAKAFLTTEKIPCMAESLGGTSARRVLFRPNTGHVRQMIVSGDDFDDNIIPVVKAAPQVVLF